MNYIRNEASKNKVQYMSGKPAKKSTDDFIYLSLEIMNMYDMLGADQTITYLKDKIKQIKAMEGESK